MDRPYINYRLKDIIELLDPKFNSDINEIIKELSFRKSPKAIELYNQLKNKYPNSSINNNEKKKDDSFEPKGYGNYSHKKKSEMEDDSDIFVNFDKALDIEITAVKQKSQEMTIDITNGQLIDSAYDSSIYQFQYRESFPIKEDIPIVIIVGGKEVSGTVVSFANKLLKISIEEDLGKTIGFAQLKIDNSFLLIRLKERLEKVTNQENKEVFNVDITKKVLGEIEPIVNIDNTLTKPATLNDNQFQSLKVSSASDVMYLWGPPGTGKTFTLAEVINLFYIRKNKILLVSNTNLAVDLLLKSLCSHLVNIGDQDFKNCSVLRYGKIADDDLEKNYGEFVNIDRAVERLSKDFQKQIDTLTKKMLTIRKAKEPYIQIKNAFVQFEKLEKTIASLNTELKNHKLFMKDALLNEKNWKQKIIQLEGEAADADNVGALKRWFTGRRKKEDIEGEILSLQNDLNDLSAKIKTTPKRISEIEDQLIVLENDLNNQKPLIKGQSLPETEKYIASFEKEESEVQTKITEIQEKINKLKDELLEKCRVTAATATQTFLKHESFKSFDIVVIDESSMLPLPLVAYVSGLAREKVIVTGDFKQLPPIITSNDPGVEKWIGSDVFTKSGIAAKVTAGNIPDNLIQLKYQYRMDDKICSLINKRFYGGSLITHKDAGRSRKKYPEIFESTLNIINTAHQFPFSNYKPRTFSRYNVLHAITIRNLIYHLNKIGFIEGPDDIGVISPYAAQADLLQKIIYEYDVFNVECGTVHKFQGNQKDIIIFDIADSYGIPNAGKLLSDFRMINVAVSRAKGFLFIVANIDYLEAKLEPTSLIRELLYEMHTDGKIIDAKDIIDLGPNTYPKFEESFLSEDIDFDKSGSCFFDQSNFDRALMNDIQSAEKWVVIFSGFSTPKRIAYWSDIFRQKISEGVKIRCVTRSPKNQGDIDPVAAKEAITQLVKMGVTVDLRHEVHDKLAFIDEEIFWIGSLNPLSHTGRTEETMLRAPSKQLSLLKARHEIYKKGFKASDSPFDVLTERENPSCPQCDGLVIFHHRGRYGPYYNCDNCEWKENVETFDRKKRMDEHKKNGFSPAIKEEKKVCELCGSDMKLRNGKFGYFYGCTSYPKCKNTFNP